MRSFILPALLTTGLAWAEPPPAKTDLHALMPVPADSTQMWWAQGFPTHTPDAPWVRVIQTGAFAMALNTETLRIPHIGPVAGLHEDWQKLPAAELHLGMTVDGKTFRCTAGGKWSKFGGPRLIESGRFFQRADVTDLVFEADDGSRLNVEARFETAAWPERLALVLAARPGILPLAAGEASFGRVQGGFGLDGTNHLEIPHAAELDPAKFTLEMWTFVPADYQVSERTAPWLICKNRNEVTEGNFGVTISNGEPRARINIGGGRENAVELRPENGRAVNIGEWNHLAISYDGDVLRLYLNGSWAGEKMIGRPRVSGKAGLAIGRRQDGAGDGYHFRGVVDEVRLYDHALTLEELRRHWNQPEAVAEKSKPVGAWTFDPQGEAAMTRPRGEWKSAAMDLSLATAKGDLRKHWELPQDQRWQGNDWHSVSLALNPATWSEETEASRVKVSAAELITGAVRPVAYDAELGWHRINLDGLIPTPPKGPERSDNDAIERVKLTLSNPTANEETARLMFEKTARGFRQRIGTPITGISAILRDAEGNPTGIPVQLSKNWHNDPVAGVYSGAWFHGISQVRLPPGATVELELTLAYGHWGGVAAASHAQLCLIGWGANQRWDQSALGSWGESICYEPEQVQRGCTIMDVRPVMVRSTGNGRPWGWTNNVGGGDFFRVFDASGERLAHAAMRTTYHKHGPCLTEVTYAGRIGTGITHSATVSLARTDDIVRGVYHLRLDAGTAVDFSRFVIFQIGADNYNSSRERRMALGNETGLVKEWDAQWGGNLYRTAPVKAAGRIPWISLHEAESIDRQRSGAWANRGLVIRSWKARLGGEDAAPWIAERGLTAGRNDSSTIDLVPPPGLTRLQSGDFIELVIEHIVMPQAATDYYGPNEALSSALARDGNTWRMIEREATGNDRRVTMKVGTLQRTHPAVTVATAEDAAEFTLTGGLGHVPVTLTGLTKPHAHTLFVDDEPLDQSVHGNDFWQTDYDPETGTWSQTYNLEIKDRETHTLRFSSTR